MSEKSYASGPEARKRAGTYREGVRLLLRQDRHNHAREGYNRGDEVLDEERPLMAGHKSTEEQDNRELYDGPSNVPAVPSEATRNCIIQVIDWLLSDPMIFSL